MNYQERYEEHQAKKKRQLMFSEGERQKPLGRWAKIKDILEHRRSQRVFNGESIKLPTFWEIMEAATTAPNSCNRHGIKMRVVDDRREKELLSGILVGGVGWVQRADKVVLFFADSVAYASPNEKEFMHYCDVGFTAMTMWLVAESKGVGCAYINPNVYWKDELQKVFGKPGYIFCGALALGHYDDDKRARRASPGELKDMLV